jgi:hypothetical protein
VPFGGPGQILNDTNSLKCLTWRSDLDSRTMADVTFEGSSANTLSNLSTFIKNDDDDLFLKCWLHFTCDSCLSAAEPCSWCAISSACVPNTLMPHPLAILSPLKSESICPLSWRERWELRAKPFSCRCSTMTFMSAVIAVLSTLTTMLVLHLLVTLIRWAVKRWRKRQPGWWRFYEARWWRSCLGNRSTTAGTQTDRELPEDEERRPLLRQQLRRLLYQSAPDRQAG